MDVFTRLASGIYIRQHHQGDQDHRPQAQRTRPRQARQALPVHDLQDGTLHRKIADTNDYVAEAKSEYDSLRKQRRLLRERLEQLDAKMGKQEERIVQLKDCRSMLLDEQKAREKHRRGKKGDKGKEDRRRGGW
ncbi:hypothetical protein Z517_01152 [Fonsecaea pedrosoi CBS 271.37]|uniref:Uncharacterized protein n=1 Tax=Fonsecaea pedrosoi CBS 271.37 TaxID=1442368 RepID=A0A0D2H4E3_9EURO|nr:uncharacterized protein Z517_01152 [Fonsecaea pedrosoi CBS 271.37]KIW85760.1 hypothetical protein Z517_01152 [Fonsecaea pedrosoi CBS 271.37]